MEVKSVFLGEECSWEVSGAGQQASLECCGQEKHMDCPVGSGDLSGSAEEERMQVRESRS